MRECLGVAVGTRWSDERGRRTAIRTRDEMQIHLQYRNGRGSLCHITVVYDALFKSETTTPCS